MNVLRQYFQLAGLHFEQMRNETWFIMMVQLVLSRGLVLALAPPGPGGADGHGH